MRIMDATWLHGIHGVRCIRLIRPCTDPGRRNLERVHSA